MIPKNPYLHATLAAAYIVGLVLLVANVIEGPDGPETILVPMTMISLFVLSAAVMGFLFLSQPILLYMEGAKQEAVTFFLKTVGTFAAITLLLLLIVANVRI